MTDLVRETLAEVAEHGDPQAAAEARLLLRFGAAVEIHRSQEREAAEICHNVQRFNMASPKAGRLPYS